ncbi:acyl-CoA-binding domain-containing protein 5-like [Panicum virgatum]|nr:acyl-CoA-binding domain-containing protein 5-like [Panicum virgatum]
MELFCELLLTAAVTLLAAFLLATLFAANDPSRRADRAAAAIAEAVLEEERIIEVDEVRRGEGRAVAEGWVEVEKAPAVAVEEVQELECLPEEEEVPVKAARDVRLGGGAEEVEEGGDGVKRRDLAHTAAATAVVAEVSLADEAVHREVIGVAGLEEGSAQDVEVKQHDMGAEVAPIEVLGAGSERQRVEVAEASPKVVEVAEVLPLETEAVQVTQDHLVTEVTPVEEVLDARLAGKSAQPIQARPDELDSETAPEEIETEAVQLKQHHLVAEVTPAEDVLDAGLTGKSVQPIQATPDELVSETAPEEILDVVLEEEEQVVEVKERELPAEAATQPVLEVPLAGKEELKDHHPVEEAVNVNEEVQSKEEAKCEAHPVDQQEELVPKEEPVARKTDVVNVSHECSSGDKVALPVEAVTLPGLPEGHTESDMDFEEWEGIERSEVEKRFGAAAAFTASGAGAASLSKLDSDVQLQLQGLLKVAIDGPCYDSTQPLTLRPSSRAKWVAWQKLGNMHPEIAMEKYMNLLSETIPGWMGNETSDTKKHDLTMTATGVQRSNQGNEDSNSIDEGTTPNPEKGQSSDAPAE